MSASFLKSSLSSMTRTRIRSPVAPSGSVEREAVPQDAVPGHAVPRDAVPQDAVPQDAVPQDAVPQDAVPSEVVPGGAVPQNAVPRERLPIDAAERRILPVERRAIEDREQRAGEAVRGPERAICAGQGRHSLKRASQEPATQETARSASRRRRNRQRRGHGSVCIEQATAARCWIGENLAALLPVRLRRTNKERLDLIWREVRPACQEERGGARHDAGR